MKYFYDKFYKKEKMIIYYLLKYVYDISHFWCGLTNTFPAVAFALDNSRASLI